MRSDAMLSLMFLATTCCYVLAQEGEESTDSIIIDASAPESDVVVLTDANFDEKVADGKQGAWFVKFYAPWCGHCKTIAPTWEQLPALLQGKASVAKLDATQEKRIAGEYGIQGFPMIKLIVDGKQYDYTGDRTLDPLVEWASGGYTSDSAQALPKEKSAIDEIKKEIYGYVQDAEKVLTFMPSILPIVLLLGLLVGLFFSRLSSGGPVLDVFVTVKVVRDDKGLGGFALNPSTLKIMTKDEERKDLKTILVGDQLLAINGQDVRTAADYKTLAHGVKEFEVMVGRSSKIAIARNAEKAE